MTGLRLCYKVGDKASSGRGIHFIYGQSDSCGVYKDDHGLIHIETSSAETTPVEACANRMYDELVDYAAEFLPEKVLGDVRHRLAYCLFNAMTAADESSATACFSKAERALDRRIVLRTRLWYLGPATVLAGVLAGGFVIGAVYLPAFLTPRIVAGLVAGMAGAWTSMLQRISKLSPGGPLESVASFGVQGSARILLGCVFGVVAVEAISANVVFGFAGTTRSGISIASFLAGFSERFVPELLEHVEAGILARSKPDAR